MGTGKTSVGKMLASALNMKWIDIDEEIEKKENMSVNDIFEKKGGDFFRECETQFLKQLNVKNTVISTGGGIVKKEINREILKSLGFIVHLRASFAKILDRVEGTHTRPLLENIDKFECIKNLWKERKNLYNIAHSEIFTDNLNIRQICDVVKLKFENSIFYKTSRANTEVLIKKNVIGYFEDIINSRNDSNSKILIVTDNKVYSIYEKLIKKISENIIIFQNGEKLKDIKNAQKIWEYAKENSFSKNDLIIGFGGGTVSDLTGFAASNFKRGIRLILIPTTLLAMIDASVGGKNGVNFNNIKNAIGTIYQPELILIDSFFLKTLPREEFLSGMGEMVKYSFLSDTSDNIENDEDFEKAINSSCVYKADIVMKDELDNLGIRSILNLGHTFGHIIESLSDFNIKHGIAVCDGMYYAWKTSFITGKITTEDMEEFITVRKKAGFDNDIFQLKEISFFDSMELIKQDKKNNSGKICLILPVRTNNRIVFEEFYFTESEIKSLWKRL